MPGIIFLAFITTYFIELFYYNIVLAHQWRKGIEKFNKNNAILMNLNQSSYKLGSGHIYNE